MSFSLKAPQATAPPQVALFSALSAVLSQIAIPISLVPVVLTQIAVLTGAGLLGWRRGILSQVVYVALGAAGLPVFAGFRSGIGVLLGPTGGFIAGYMLSALVVGLLVERSSNSAPCNRWALFLIMLLGALVVYVPGIPWLMHVTGIGLREAVTAYVLPFLLGDGVKAAVSAVLVGRLRRHLRWGCWE